MLANPLPEEKRGSSLLQQRGFAFLLRLFLILLAQQSFPLLRQVVEPTAMLKASSALVGFLLMPQAALAAPAPVLTATAGNGQVRLSWSYSGSSIDHSRWQYRKKKGAGNYGAWTTIPGGRTPRAHTVTSLDNASAYTFQVARALLSGPQAPFSNEVTATPTAPTPTAPAAPTGFTAGAGNGQVTLNWTKPAGTITGYKLLYSKTGTRSSATWAVMTGAGANTVRHTVSSLDNGSEYSFKIRAVNSGGDGTETGWVTATPFTTALTVEPGDKQVTLNWSIAEPNSSPWVYRQKKGAGSYGGWLRAGARTARSKVVTGLENGSAYTFQVALDTGISIYLFQSNEVSATPVAATTAGVTLSTSELTVNEGSTGVYTVKLATDPGGTVTVSPTSADPAAASVSPSSLTFTSSNYSTAQTVTVTGESDTDTTNETVNITHGVSGYGSVTSGGTVAVTVTDTTTAPLKPPTGLSVDPGPDRLYLSWTAPTDANRTGWQVRHGPLGLVGGNIATDWGAWSAISGASTTSHTITGATISEGTTHFVELRATDGSRFSSKVGGSALPDSGVSHDLRVSGGGFSLPVDEGSSVTYRIRLKSRGTGPVTVTPSCTACDLTFNPTSVTFSTTNWNDWQNITVSAARDTDATDDTVTIGYAVSGGGYPTVTDTSRVVIKDTGTTLGGDIAPAQPTNLKATPGDRQVTLTWTKPPGTITGYEVRYSKGSDPYTEWAAIPGATGSTESHTVTGLVGGSEYSFEIRAVNGALKSVDSEVARATTTAPAGAGAVGITLDRSIDPSAESWDVLYGPSSNRPDPVPSNWKAATLPEGWKTGNISPTTASGLFQLDGMGLLPGTLLAATTPSQLNHALGKMGWLPGIWIAQSAGGRVSLTVRGLTSGVEYSFKVHGVHSNGGRGDIYPANGWITATPGAGTASSGSGGGGGSSTMTPSRTGTPVFQLPSDPDDVSEGEAITLEITSSSSLTGTHEVSLTFSDRNGSGFTASDIPGGLGPRSFNAAFGSSPSRSGTITIPTSSDSAVEGREHYRIKLNAASGYSLGNNVTADGTLLDPVPAKPTGLTATPGHGQVTLNWDDPKDASITGWQVQYKEGDGSYGNWENISNATATTTRHTVTGLTSGTRYAFRLRAVNAVGAGEASDPVAATTLHADDARAAKARKAAVTGLSRATLSSATDVIGGRISGELSITPDSDGSIGEQALGIVEDLLGISDTALPSSLSMEGIGEQLWHQTFQLTPPPLTPPATADAQRAQADDTTAGQQRNWALWGAGDLRLFNGDDTQEQISYEGNLKTAWVGIDQQFSSPWRAGVAASFSLGESDYTYERTSGETAGGSIKSRLTAFYPYGAVQLNERLRLWGTAGVGFGELRHQESSNDTDTQQQEQQGDLRIQLALVGFEQQLSSIGTWDFSLAGDLGLIKTSSQWPDHSGLEDLSMTLTRARLGVDSSFPLSDATRGYLNLRGRMDGGEQQMGAAEAVAGLHYTSARLSALLQGRQTYAFNGDYSESGIMGQLLFSSQEDGTGLALELQPSYGHYGDAQQPFFFDDDQLQALTGQSSSQHDEGLGLKSMVGYGFRPHDNHLLLTPFAELTFTQGRRYLLGVGLNMEAPPWEVKLTGSREETGNTSPTGKVQLLFSTEL